QTAKAAKHSDLLPSCSLAVRVVCRSWGKAERGGGKAPAPGDEMKCQWTLTAMRRLAAEPPRLVDNGHAATAEHPEDLAARKGVRPSPLHGSACGVYSIR